MIEFIQYASGSTGNLYCIKNGTDAVMLECGLRFPEIRKAFDYKVSRLSGCLVTHEHKDHCKAADNVMKYGVDLYMTKGTANALKLSGHRLNHIKAGTQFSIGSFKIMPFTTEHDAAEPVGFLIASGNEKLLFATDTYFIRHRFKGLTHICVECNYHLPILDQNIKDGLYPRVVRNRVRKSHMCFETCKDFLLAQDLSAVKEVHLLHLSSANGDAKMFTTEIEKATGRPVYV